MALTSAQTAALNNAGVAANIARLLLGQLGGSFSAGASTPAPSYSKPVAYVAPVSVAPPPLPPDPPNVFSVSVREGLRVGVATIKSTGRVHFEVIETDSGWRFPERAQYVGDGEALHTVVDGYTGKLIGKRPYCTIPSNALIRGIKVYVRRRRI